MIQAGTLHDRITIQTAVETRGNEGEVIQTWGDTKTLWARVTPLTGNESEEADKVVGDIDHKVLIRYFSTLNSTKQRFKYRNRILNIVRIINVDERRVGMEVGCREQIV